MSIDTIKAIQKLCIKIQDCLPHLYPIIGQNNAEELAEASENLIHCMDNEPIDPHYVPPRETTD